MSAQRLGVWYILNVKQCGKCKSSKPLEEFDKNKTKPDGVQTFCKTCKKEYNIKYYAKTKNVHNPSRYENRRRHNAEVRDYILSVKDNKPCTDCGISYRYWQMDFDHLENKEFNIGTERGKKLDRIKKEIAKCELVCSNCHRTRTHERTFGPQALK